MTTSIKQIEDTNLAVEVTWTEEETPQLSGVVLYNRIMPNRYHVTIDVDKIEGLILLLEQLVRDRNIQQRIKRRK